MGDSGSQVLGFALAALGLAVELDGRRLDGRDAPAADPRARGPDPRHDARHRRAAARGPAGHAGRPRPHVAPARLPGPLRQARRRPARRRLGRARRSRASRYKVLDDTRVTLVGVLITFALPAPVRQLPRRRRRAAGSRRRRGSFLRSLLVHRRRLVEVLVDFALITASFTRRLHHPPRGHRRHLAAAHLRPSRCRSSSSRATSSSSLFGLYRGVWRYAGARDAASIFAAVVRLRGRGVPLPRGDVDVGRRSRASVFVIDALICIAADRRLPLLGARRRARVSLARRPRRARPDADRRRRPKRPQPAARAARDARRARRRLRRRRPARCRRRRHPGRAGRRRRLDEIGWIARPASPGHRARHDPRRAARTARRRRRGLRARRHPVPVRPPRRSTSTRAPSSAPPSSERRRDAATARRGAGRAVTLADRLLAAVPLASIYLWLCDRLLRRGVEAHDAVALHATSSR